MTQTHVEITWDSIVVCNREATWIFAGNGGDWSIKMGSHGGGDDNSSLIEFGQAPIDDGSGRWRCEGPHQTYNDVSGGSGSAPGIGGSQQVGVKGISWDTGNGTIHHAICKPTIWIYGIPFQLRWMLLSYLL